MIDEIKDLQNKGLSIRSIAEELGISKSKVEWELKANGTESQDTQQDNTQQDTISQDTQQDNETDLNEIPEKVKIRYPNLVLKDYKEEDYNRLGVRKLKKSDYTAEELKVFPDAPYFDEKEALR